MVVSGNTPGIETFMPSFDPSDDTTEFGGADADLTADQIAFQGDPLTIIGTPTFSVTPVSHNEGNSGTTPYVFTVTLNPPLGSTATSPATIQFQTSDGTATVADDDYQPTSGTLTFQPGVTTQSITVLVNGDTKIEPTETFNVTLSNPVERRAALQPEHRNGHDRERRFRRRAEHQQHHGAKRHFRHDAGRVHGQPGAGRQRHGDGQLPNARRYGRLADELHRHGGHAHLRARHDDSNNHGAGHRQSESVGDRNVPARVEQSGRTQPFPTANRPRRPPRTSCRPWPFRRSPSTTSHKPRPRPVRFPIFSPPRCRTR